MMASTTITQVPGGPSPKSVDFYTVKTGASSIIHELKDIAKQEHVGEAQEIGNPVKTFRCNEYHGIQLHGWLIGSSKSHITPIDVMDKVGEEVNLTPPEMVFGRNQLVFYHEPSGFCYNFIASEALKGAHFNTGSEKLDQNVKDLQLKVAIAKNKKSPLQENDVKELEITYDWTFTTNYKGTLQNLHDDKDTDCFQITPTNERIDYDKLREREPILWFDNVNLYEDELHDHGVSVMSVKMRVMPSGFFVLARYFLRLDHVLVRLNETRIHHVFGTSYMLRETTKKEASFKELISRGHSKNMANYTDVDTYQQLLPVKEAFYEKISFQ